MNLLEYVKAKYPNGTLALTKTEAKIIGIAYPLEKGWMNKNRLIQITLQMYRMLRPYLESKNNAYSKRAIVFLDRHFEDNHIELVKTAISATFPRVDLLAQQNRRVCTRCQSQQEEQNNEVRDNVSALLRILDDLHIAELKRQLSLK